MPVQEPGGWFLGARPGGPKPRREGWERMTYFSLYGGCAFLVLGLCYGPTTSIKLWARDEAEGRNSVVAAGGEVEVGQARADEKAPEHAWARASIGAVPTRGGDDDDDDE